jgi:hypothetical protein
VQRRLVGVKDNSKVLRHRIWLMICLNDQRMKVVVDMVKLGLCVLRCELTEAIQIQIAHRVSSQFGFMIIHLRRGYEMTYSRTRSIGGWSKQIKKEQLTVRIRCFLYYMLPCSSPYLLPCYGDRLCSLDSRPRFGRGYDFMRKIIICCCTMLFLSDRV